MMEPIVASFGCHISAIRAIPLTRLWKHLRQPSTSTAIHPELPSLLPFFPYFTLCHRHARSRNQAVRPLRLPAIHRILPPPQPPCHPRPVTVSQKPSWPILVDWCMYFSQNYRCFIHNSHDIILLLRNYLISPQSLMQQYCSWIGKTIRDHQRTGGVKNGWGSTTISCEGIATGELFHRNSFTFHIHHWL